MGISRSENMRRIRSKDTAPEVAVRQLVRRLGFTGYRLHRKDLPGKPDVAFIGRKKAIFVHGCFWHGHDCKEGARRPKSNAGYWISKIDSNIQRDITHAAALLAKGWKVLVVWDCELNSDAEVTNRIRSFMKDE